MLQDRLYTAMSSCTLQQQQQQLRAHVVLPSATPSRARTDASDSGTETSSSSCSGEQSAHISRQRNPSGDSGRWRSLPDEIIVDILWRCSTTQLAMLKTTCSYFRSLPAIDNIARTNLKAIPRAKSLKPNVRESETYLALLHFVNQQSAAAAQATAIACGGHHTSALMHECKDSEASTSALTVARHHSLYTFGRNFHGQLGSGDFEDRPSPQAVSLGFQPCQSDATLEEETTAAVVACGTHHSACMSRRGELFSWGMCRNGELGQGRWASVEVSSPMACRLCPVRIISVSCGAGHTLAIGESGSLWSCGSNFSGQLGNGSLIDCPQLQKVQNIQGSRIVLAAAGTAHSVALASDGSLYTWGDGTRGQLGHSQLQSMATAQNSIILLLPQKIQRLDPNHLSPVDRVTAMSARGFHTLVLTVGGSVLGFGANSSGQLGLGDTADRWKPTRVNLAMPGEEGCCIKVIQIACGAQHSVALVSKQGRTDIRSTGANTWGQLGVGDLAPRLRFTATLPVQRVTAVQAGDEHCAAVTEEGQLYMWGRGDSGQLGLGDLACRQSPSLLEGFSVVHPDYTLRRSKRTLPLIRPIASAEPPCSDKRAGRRHKQQQQQSVPPCMF